jgi:hypothetical protein
MGELNEILTSDLARSGSHSEVRHRWIKLQLLKVAPGAVMGGASASSQCIHTVLGLTYCKAVWEKSIE